MQRLHYIDRAKLLAMLMVVMVHVSGIMGVRGDGRFTLYTLLMACYMHIFIVCSGLVCSAKDKSLREIGEDCKKRSRRLLLPFALFFVVTAWAMSVSWHDAWFEYTKLGAWYLLVLWECYMLHYLFILWRKVVRTIWTDILFGVVVAVGLKVLYHVLPPVVSAGLSLEGLQVYYPYFFAAVLLRDYQWAERLLQKQWLLPCVVVASVAVFVAKYNYQLPFTAELCTITSTAVVFWLLYALERVPAHYLKTIDTMGQATMGIYLIHFMFLRIISLARIHTYIHTAPPICQTASVDTLVLLISVAILVASYWTEKLFRLCLKE